MESPPPASRRRTYTRKPLGVERVDRLELDSSEKVALIHSSQKKKNRVFSLNKYLFPFSSFSSFFLFFLFFFFSFFSFFSFKSFFLLFFLSSPQPIQHPFTNEAWKHFAFHIINGEMNKEDIYCLVFSWPLFPSKHQAPISDLLINFFLDPLERQENNPTTNFLCESCPTFQ